MNDCHDIRAPPRKRWTTYNPINVVPVVQNTKERHSMSTVALNERNANMQQKQNDNEAQIRPIPATKIANLKRKMKGAHRRVLRCSKEIEQMRADIRRKYFIKRDDNGLNEEHIPISSAEITGLRLNRRETERELAQAKGDYYSAERAYRSATSHNSLWSKKATRRVWKDNRTRREAGKLMRITIEILKKHGANGGAKDVAELRALALAGDVKGFRKAFDEKVSMWAPDHFDTISGVSTVKTEIIRELMEQFKSEQISLETPASLTA